VVLWTRIRRAHQVERLTSEARVAPADVDDVRLADGRLTRFVDANLGPKSVTKLEELDLGAALWLGERGVVSATNAVV
jgi:hypothetical protein